MSNPSEKELQPPVTTTDAGIPAQATSTRSRSAPAAPVCCRMHYLIEKLAHFVRERVPDRVYHVKGGGAFGYFEVTADVTQWTKAAFLNKVGKRTPLFVRFSTVAGEEGYPDTDRDVRGFAMKFYTEEGNYDLVGNNTPVFFVRDPMKFPDFIHSQKRLPDTGLRSNNMQWDFWTLSPESAHQVTILMSDRGTPAHLAPHERLQQPHVHVGERRGQEVLGQVPLQDRAGHPELHRRRGQGHARRGPRLPPARPVGGHRHARTTRPGASRCRSCRTRTRRTTASTPST